ncbi:MAG: cytochrome c [Candidatus Methylophosphatis roskildensis]
MSTASSLLVVCMVWSVSVVAADRVRGPDLGQPVSEQWVAARNSSIFPDGRGLPEGRGTANDGRPIYEQKCASCHGKRGEGGSGGHLVGPGPLTGEDADKTVGSYWPFATTIFDFTRRSMPMAEPGSLSADETYALTAYLLHLNGIVAADMELNATALPRVKMPNRDGFVWIDVPQPGRRK